MGDATVAVSYAVFVVLFVVLNIESAEKFEANQIFQAVTTGYENMPFSNPGEPPRKLRDISNQRDLKNWLNGTFAAVTFKEQEQWTSNPWNVDWPPAGAASVAPVSVGGFNRILLVRFTGKRWKLEPNSRKANLWSHELSFAESGLEDTDTICVPRPPTTTTTTMAATTTLDPNATNGTNTTTTTTTTTTTNDNTTTSTGTTTTITTTDTTTVTTTTENRTGLTCFRWSTDKGYHQSAGYTSQGVFLDPMDGRESFEGALNDMDAAGVFDLRLSQMKIDIMVYNANVDLFMHIDWEFNYDFAGNCDMKVNSRPFNLNLFNTSVSKYEMIFTLRMVLMVMVILFFFVEIRKMCDVGLFTHFKHMSAIVDMISLFLCTFVLFSYWLLQEEEVFNGYFDFSRLMSTDLDSKLKAYKELEIAAASVEDQSVLIALNLMMVSIRSVVMLAGLQSKGDLGMLLVVLDVCFFNLLYFSGMFLMIMSGFVLMAYFTFGAGYGGMSSPANCFYSTFSMLTGRQVYHEMAAADPVMAPIFYYVFYILFYLVMVNMFVSILLSGYDVADYQVSSGIKDKNPFLKMAEEFKREIFSRLFNLGSAVANVVYGCVKPLIQSFSSMFKRIPLPPISALMGGRKSSRDDEDDDEEFIDRRKPKDTKMDGIVLVVFMTLFITLMSLQTRGEVSYYVAQATLYRQAFDTILNDQGLAEDTAYKELHSFQDVYKWANHVLPRLYSNNVCVESEGLITKAKALNRSESEVAQCSNALDGQQIVQVLGDWNIGFMTTTFVRLTIQPSCIVATPAPWGKGQPLKATYDGLAANCFTSDGYSLANPWENTQPGLIPVLLSGTNTTEGRYVREKTDLGSSKLLGGYVFSFGVTQAQSKEILGMLRDNKWFTTKSSTMIFEWITYNGNLDMFTSSKVTFNLLATGALEKTLEAKTIPLNIAEGGGPHMDLRTTFVVLYGCYIIFVVFFIGNTFYSIWKGIRRHGNAQKFFTKEFLTDIWTITDTLSLVLSMISIFYFISYMTMPFRDAYRFDSTFATRYEVPNEAIKQFNISRDWDATRPMEDDMYIFRQFELASEIYSTFLLIAAANSFFIAIKIVKFMGSLPGIDVFSNTLKQGQARNLYFMLIIYLFFNGFSLFFHIIFGHQVRECDTLISTGFMLFDWMIGDYDLDSLSEVNADIATIFFVIFMVSFYFIAVNMFLATMLNTYSETVANILIDKEKQALITQTTNRMIEYRDKEALSRDVELGIKEVKHELILYVRRIKAPRSTTAQAGVEVGHIITKVNGAKGFLKLGIEPSHAEVLAADCLSEEDGHLLRVQFKDPKAMKTSWMATLGLTSAAAEEQSDRIKPTVKNFWRDQGAITWIAREIQQEDQGAGEQAGDDGDEEKSEGGSEGGGDEAAVQDKGKLIKIQIKRRLDSLLFSRWTPGKCGQARTDAVEAIAAKKKEPADNPAAMLNMDTWDMEDLRERIEGMPVSGEEAWLDCLVTAIEVEMEDDSVITELLRTTEMQEMANKKAKRVEQRSFEEFYRRASQFLEVLECKAGRRYFMSLHHESELHQEALRKQNDVLHDYVCELEKEFKNITGEIASYKAKKEVMLTKLAGLLDSSVDGYASMDAKMRAVIEQKAAGSIGVSPRITGRRRPQKEGR